MEKQNGVKPQKNVKNKSGKRELLRTKIRTAGKPEKPRMQTEQPVKTRNSEVAVPEVSPIVNSLEKPQNGSIATSASVKPLEMKAKISDASKADGPITQVRRILQQAELENDPEALRLLRQARGNGPQAEIRLLGDLAELVLRRVEKPAARASQVIQPGGGGLPVADLRSEYEKRMGAVRPGDMAGVMEVKREFRKRGLEVY